MYDLYLNAGSRALPELNDLIQVAPALADSGLQKRMLQRSPGSHFLGLDLSIDVATTLMKRLKSHKASGYIVPSAYRHPKITVEQALSIATPVISELYTKYISDHTLGPVHFVQDEPICWTFGAVSEEWVKEDRIPGALFASVDKLDGHIWQVEEFDRLRG